jgi:hypothetical protein
MAILHTVTWLFFMTCPTWCPLFALDSLVLVLYFCPLSLVSTIEELSERKSSGSSPEIREYDRRDPSRWLRGTLYLQTLALTSPISGGRSDGVVRSRTQTTELYFSAMLEPWAQAIEGRIMTCSPEFNIRLGYWKCSIDRNVQWYLGSVFPCHLSSGYRWEEFLWLQRPEPEGMRTLPSVVEDKNIIIPCYHYFHPVLIFIVAKFLSVLKSRNYFLVCIVTSQLSEAAYTWSMVRRIDWCPRTGSCSYGCRAERRINNFQQSCTQRDRWQDRLSFQKIVVEMIIFLSSDCIFS